MTSVQRIYMSPPPSDIPDIGISIRCFICKAIRTYKITNNLNGLLLEENSGLGITVSCEECGHVTEVKLGRIEAEGYSAKDVILPAATGIDVKDDVGLRNIGEDTGEYWQHRIKCMSCSLHFVVCSDYEEWPLKGTTREQRMGEATGLIFCPECGSNNVMLHYVIKIRGFIFQIVPGIAKELSFHSGTEEK